MPRVIRRGSAKKIDSMQPRSREDYTYVAVLKTQRAAVEKSLELEGEKYGYRDFSTFLKNLLGYYTEQWERTHRMLDSKDYSVNNVLDGGSKYGVPYSMKSTCKCDCHTALELLKKVKANRIKDRELIESVDRLEVKK